MPNYDYKCTECGHNFEALLVSVAEGAAIERKACPECKRRKVHRIIGAPAVHMRYSLLHPRHMRGQKSRPKKGGAK